MSITTKTGDSGETDLMFKRRAVKDDPRIEAYGVVDELNAALGWARANSCQPETNQQLVAIQGDLIKLMGEVATHPEDAPKYRASRFDKLTSEDTNRLEQSICEQEKQLPELKGWALPGGTVESAALDLARVVCRRAERRVASLFKGWQPEESQILVYLNRLSDLLWLLARQADPQSEKERQV